MHVKQHAETINVDVVYTGTSGHFVACVHVVACVCVFCVCMCVCVCVCVLCVCVCERVFALYFVNALPILQVDSRFEVVKNWLEIATHKK